MGFLKVIGTYVVAINRRREIAWYKNCFRFEYAHSHRSLNWKDKIKLKTTALNDIADHQLVDRLSLKL